MLDRVRSRRDNSNPFDGTHYGDNYEYPHDAYTCDTAFLLKALAEVGKGIMAQQTQLNDDFVLVTVLDDSFIGTAFPDSLLRSPESKPRLRAAIQAQVIEQTVIAYAFIANIVGKELGVIGHSVLLEHSNGEVMFAYVTDLGENPGGKLKMKTVPVDTDYAKTFPFPLGLFESTQDYLSNGVHHVRQQ